MEEIVWDSPECEHQERGVFWTYGIGAIAAILIFLALWQGNFLFAIFILIATTTLLLVHRNHPPHHRVSLLKERIVIGTHDPYKMTDFLGFVLEEGRQEDYEWGRVLLRPKRHFRPYFPILVPREKLHRVRTHIAQYLPELEYEESLTDALVRLFKL